MTSQTGSKLHAAADTLGNPVRLLAGPGQEAAKPRSPVQSE